jgi:RPA family protein
LTEKTRVTGNGGGQWRAQVADPTGIFDVYAGSQYEAQASEYLLTAATPSFVAMVGRPRVFEMTSSGRGTALALNPELMVASDSMSRDIWTQETIRLTLERINVLKAGISADAKLALEYYGQPNYADYKAMLGTAYATLPRKVVSEVRP